MTGKALKVIALAVMTAGAIATAAPVHTASTEAPAPRGPRPEVPEQICVDADVARTFGGDGSAGCHEYLDACLGELTQAQRTEWRQSVNACLSASEPNVFRCYTAVPWC